jgi:hypothetical protein
MRLQTQGFAHGISSSCIACYVPDGHHGELCHMLMRSTSAACASFPVETCGIDPPQPSGSNCLQLSILLFRLIDHTLNSYGAQARNY